MAIGIKDENFRLTQNGAVYSITVDKISGAWKIWDGGWEYSFGAGASQPETDGTECEVWFDSPTNFSTTSETPVTITFTLVEGSDVKNSSIPSILKIEPAE